MIGNMERLPGVPVDIYSYYSFFTSPMGGNWCHEEIDIFLNTTRHCLSQKIVEFEKANYDYVITIFLGHGAEMRDETVLIINGQRETTMMNQLMSLSQKQLLIIECCRKPPQMSSDLAFIRKGATMLSMSRDPIRQAYENRIWSSVPQETVLFACDQGEIARGGNGGGYYSSHLLRATKMVLDNSTSQFVSVSMAHHKAVSLMRENSFMRQHPQILQPRCPINRRLPLAINPNFWGYDY